MNSHTVTGGGRVRLHVLETGNPVGKPILFIHGFTQCCLAWSKQMSSDLADTFRLVAMDIRGHGLSEKPRDAYGDSKLWADDVHAVIEELELDEPLLVGWSYGGVVMSDYVGSYGEEEISGTSWVGAVCRLGEPLVAPGFLGEEFVAGVPGFFSENVSESVAALDKLIHLCIPSGLSLEERYLLLGSSVVVPPYVRQGLLSRNLDNDAVVESMSKPILISWGDKDASVLTSMRDHLSGLASHAEVRTYPGVGHAPFWEAPERFNRELREFRESI
jgi:pimeloyl-ACP methyl ester carboxylesterase